MPRLNMRNTINNTKGKINRHYDMTYDNILQIYRESRDWYDLVSDSFRLGYAQGMKAAKAEMKRKGMNA